MQKKQELFMEKTIYLNEYKKIIDNLRKARIQAGLTQLEVAKKLKKHQSYISKIENRDRRLDIIELKLLAGLYKKNINYFVKNV
jgi:transcriptional regulator with XRE-family HTH domain